MKKEARDGIEAMGSPRVATQYPGNGKFSSFYQAVHSQGIRGILRACGKVTASCR